MDDEYSPWTMPKEPSEWKSLYAAFHDARLLHLTDLPPTSGFDIEITINFPEAPIPSPNQVRLEARSVTHALVIIANNRAVTPTHHPSMTTAEWELEVAAYWADSRQETIGIGELTERVEADGLYAIDARYGCIEDRKYLCLGGVADRRTASWELRIVAKSIGIATPENAVLTLDELQQMGEAAWEHWSRKWPAS